MYTHTHTHTHTHTRLHTEPTPHLGGKCDLYMPIFCCKNSLGLRAYVMTVENHHNKLASSADMRAYVDYVCMRIFIIHACMRAYVCLVYMYACECVLCMHSCVFIRACLHMCMMMYARISCAFIHVYTFWQ